MQWNRTVAGVKMKPSSKEREHRSSPGACQQGRRIRSISHQQRTQKHLQTSDRMQKKNLSLDRLSADAADILTQSFHLYVPDTANRHIMKLV